MTKKQNATRKDEKMSTKVKLTGLWTALMLLYIYADIFSFYRPGHIAAACAGFMGPLAVSQMTLAASGVLMLIPVLVMIAGLFWKAGPLRLLNMVFGVLYAAVGVGNLIGETWAYYLVYGVIEILIAILIAATAFKWPSNNKGEKNE